MLSRISSHETRNEIDVYYGRNKDCLQNGHGIRRDLSVLNSISHACEHELSLECRSGLKLPVILLR